jgi:dTDP-4-dehydrorhamnose reductase
VRALRYPVLWERTARNGLSEADWRWPEERLGRLRELGIRPIAGLVHHGSGPPGTDLLDGRFAERLAEYARACAERFPWVEEWTPVNEPLTTARFSALYGHWYPHVRDDRAFARAVLTQCRAVVLAMRAIRTVNADARLVQTEDLAETHSTPALRYQAAFENERRWLTFDLLCGRMTEAHPLWRWLLRAGASQRELDWFAENPCPPDVLGVNYYIPSERFLDERLDRYPADTHGGNGREAYADVNAVRVRRSGIRGLEALLGDAWRRYGLPLAVTEAHNGCTREEQLRWLDDVWHAALGARRRGIDVRAVTVWSLLGAYDWNSLVTQRAGYYEPGAFDVRQRGAPRPTALAAMVQGLAETGCYEHPVLASPGWWRRRMRLEHPPTGSRGRPELPRRLRQPRRPVLVTGSTGTLGRAFARICHLRGLEFRLTSRSDMDVADRRSVEHALATIQPWAVVNTAGYVRVDDAERDCVRCERENAEGPAVLAAACAALGLPLVTYSSDLVFDGLVAEPYVESSAVSPLSVYGRTKADAEQRVFSALPSALVIRTSAFFGPWDRHNFLSLALARLAAHEDVLAAGDTVVSPTYVPDLVHATLDLLLDRETGVWHLANPGAVSWAELARRAADAVGVSDAGVRECTLAELDLAAPRPRYSVLGSERATLLPPLDDAIARYASARR